MRTLPALLIILLAALPVTSQTPKKIHFGAGRGHVLRFSPNNDLLAFAVGNKVKLFRSGIEVASFHQHSSAINDVAFDPTGETVAACHANGYLTLWSIPEKSVIHDIKVSAYSLLECRFLENRDKVVILSSRDLTLWSSSGEAVTTDADKHGLTALAVSRQGRFIASAGQGEVRIWDGLGNKIACIGTSHKRVISLAFSPDGTSLAGGCEGGTVTLWKTDGGQPSEHIFKTAGRINALEFSSDGKYLAAGAEAFFILSLTKDQPHVVFRKLGAEVVSAGFAPSGRHVGILEDLAPYAKIYDISDLHIPPVFQFRDEEDIIAPQVYLSSPARIVGDRINYSKDMIDIQGSIFDDYGVRGLRINGMEAPHRENGKFIIHLPLTPGENPVTLEASDINGNQSVKYFVVNRKVGLDDYDPMVARNFLFVASINSYQHWPRLNNAVADGNALASVLMEQYDFKLPDMVILKDEQATRNNIYRGLRSLIEKVTPRDNLIVYFSGHGHFDELLNEGYWIPVEANQNAEGEYLPNSSILKIVESVNSQHTFLIADACFSGSLFSDMRRSAGYVDKVDRIRSRWGLTSGRLEVVSDGEAGSNSPFARILLGYLEDYPKSEFAVGELVQHVKMMVAEISGQTPIGSPLRIAGDEGGEFVFRKSAQNGPVIKN